MNMNIKRLSAAVLGVLLFFAGGCGCKHVPDRHPLNISLPPGSRPQRIEVHIFAVNAAESQYWETVSMSKYWGSGDRDRNQMFRQKDMFVMNFGPDKPQQQSFSPQTTSAEWNQLWDKWEKQKAANLFVFASLPSDPSQPFEDRNGSLDARRLVIPLDRCRWENKQQPVDVILTPAKVELATVPKEKEKE